jgi:peptidoglycan/LPS O-acetylase OafA/YrhL
MLERTISLSDALRGRRNNLDLLRLIAASAVIYGHAPAITGQKMFDVGAWLFEGHDYSGSFAVKFFFFASGLVVTNSLRQRPSFLRWIAARILRIYPAFLVVLALSVLVVGPAFTSRSLPDYFGDQRTWTYFEDSALSLVRGSGMQWYLPGVFEDHANKAINGSLWTLPSEFYCYGAVLVAGLVGAIFSRVPGTVAMVAFALAALLWPATIGIVPTSGQEQHLLPCFVVGMLAALWSDRILLDGRIAAGVLLLALIMRLSKADFFQAAYCMVFFYAALVLSVWPPFARLRPRYDISYGVYLYGFVVQQILVEMMPGLPNAMLIIIALCLCYALGTLSWLLIERPANQVAKKMPAAISAPIG